MRPTVEPARRDPAPRLASLCALALCCAALTPARAAEPALAEPANDVRGWLARIHGAASQRSFQGTFVVSGAGSVSSSRIAHYCEGRNQYQRVESLDGQARQVFRYNDRVQTVWPEAKLALIEKREPVTSFPALLQAGDDRITDFYEVRRQGTERIAGHEANVLVVTAKDAHRYGYRLWSEKSTGLLLRADVIGERDEVIESAAFSDVVIGVKPQPEAVLAPMKRLGGYRILHSVLVPTRLEAEGWAVRQSVPGFRLVSCLKRPMGVADGDTEDVVQAIFADGLTHVSLFIEPFRAQQHRQPVFASVGATRTLMRRIGQWWITVMGDVPASTLQMVADNLERRP
jgi:sigma-E factor negative regulatory protein RseB